MREHVRIVIQLAARSARKRDDSYGVWSTESDERMRTIAISEETHTTVTDDHIFFSDFYFIIP